MTLQKVTALTIACWCFIGGFSSVVGAQTIAGSFGELSGRLKLGKVVSVTDDGGRTIKGKLTDLSATSLKVQVDGKGLLAGAALGLLVGINAEDCFGCPGPGGTAVVGAIGLGGLGAGIGAAIGAGTSRDRLVYRASPHPPVAFSRRR